MTFPDPQWDRFNDDEYKVYYDEKDRRPFRYVVVGPRGRIVKVTRTERQAHRELVKAMNEPDRPKTWELPEVDIVAQHEAKRKEWGYRLRLATILSVIVLGIVVIVLSLTACGEPEGKVRQHRVKYPGGHYQLLICDHQECNWVTVKYGVYAECRNGELYPKCKHKYETMQHKETEA